MVVTLAFLGLATYAAFPAVPPWLASTGHYIPNVTQIVAVVSTHLGFLDTRALFERGEAHANLVAAVPSLHVAFSMLAALFLGTLLRRRALRSLLFLYPVAMGFALVYTGEHYTVDVVLGWLYAIAVFRLVSRFVPVESAHARTADDHGRRLPRRR